MGPAKPMAVSRAPSRSGFVAKKGLCALMIAFSAGSSAWAQGSKAGTPAPQRAAILVAAGEHKGINYSRFYESTGATYRALRSRGWNASEISVLYADGTTKDNTAYWREYDRPWPLTDAKDFFIESANPDLDRDGKPDIRREASLAGLYAEIDAQGKKLKSGDSLFISLTGHSMSNLGLCLWNNTYCSPEELGKMIENLADRGIKIKLLVNADYGGKFLALTRPGICVASATNEKSELRTRRDEEPFLQAVAKRLGAKGDTSGLSGLLDAGAAGDIPGNHPRSSLDVFLDEIQKKRPGPPPQPCRSIPEATGAVDAAIANLKKLPAASGKAEQVKKLRAQLEDLRRMLADPALNPGQEEAKKIEAEIAKRKARWDALSPGQRDKERGNETRIIDGLRAELALKQKPVKELFGKQDRLLNELRFLSTASAGDLSRYLDIKECLNEKI